MAWIQDWQVRSPIDRLIQQFDRVGFGERRDEVDAALTKLLDQIEEASRAIEVAAQRHRIDTARLERSAAEERLEQLEAVYVD